MVIQSLRAFRQVGLRLKICLLPNIFQWFGALFTWICSIFYLEWFRLNLGGDFQFGRPVGLQAPPMVDFSSHIFFRKLAVLDARINIYASFSVAIFVEWCGVPDGSKIRPKSFQNRFKRAIGFVCILALIFLVLKIVWHLLEQEKLAKGFDISHFFKTFFILRDSQFAINSILFLNHVWESKVDPTSWKIMPKWIELHFQRFLYWLAWGSNFSFMGPFSINAFNDELKVNWVLRSVRRAQTAWILLHRLESSFLDWRC